MTWRSCIKTRYLSGNVLAFGFGAFLWRKQQAGARMKTSWARLVEVFNKASSFGFSMIYGHLFLYHALEVEVPELQW